MITGIHAIEVRNQNMSMPKASHVAQASQVSLPQSMGWSPAASNAVKTNGINLARTVKFTGALQGAFSDLNQSMVTCKTKDQEGEAVGSRANVNKLLHDFAGEFAMPNDAIKTTIKTGSKSIDGKDVPVYARTQIKLLEQDKAEDRQKIRFQMAVRKPSKDSTIMDKSEQLAQKIDIDLTPINYKGEGTHEQAYVLNTKGNLMAVVEDGNDVLLTNAGKISKIDTSTGSLDVNATQYKNVFKPFVAPVQEVVDRKPMPSIGEGGKVVIGMQQGRFTNEIIASIKEFIEKIENEEIVLPQFVAKEGANDGMYMLLAGGFGSRAEYTNASSSAIFHDAEDGAQSTKGVFRTATGLTPMETTLVTLHLAGLVDCSKGVIGIGKNIEFYENEGINRGNGEFSANMYKMMKEEGKKFGFIFPNDSVSRMTEAVEKAHELISSGNAAIAMVSKEVKSEECINNFGIMKLGADNEILEFAEKPKQIPAGYEINGNCLTNTFQFAVSDEAFQVIDMFEELFEPVKKNGKEVEARDWSKQFVPIIKTLTQNDDFEVIKDELSVALNTTPDKISDEIIANAKATLGDQKIYSVPTSEAWADCGTLNQLAYTTMQVASGDFKLEDFERAHTLACVDTQTGLITSSPEQKERITSKYKIDGQVMVVPQARKITDDEVADIPVTVYKNR